MLKRVLGPIEFSPLYSYSAYRYEGEAFTGIEYYVDKKGRVTAEQSYFEGMRWGFSRSWRDNNTLRDEYSWKLDSTNGICTKYYLDGHCNCCNYGTLTMLKQTQLLKVKLNSTVRTVKTAK